MAQAAAYFKIMTRYGVERNLSISPFYVKTEEAIYYFSSLTHEKKFRKMFHVKHSEVNEYLNKKYGVNIKGDLLAELILYQKIETRGYRVEWKGCVFTCQNEIYLDLQQKLEKTLVNL